LDLDNEGNPRTHSGIADGVLKLKLPMKKDIDQILLISVDVTLPKKKRPRDNAMQDEVNRIDDEIQLLGIGKNKVTVTAQTYQNYKSALKWWHEFNCPAWDKVGIEWPADCDRAINNSIASYKRDIGVKKRRGVMVQQEGKRPYNLFGYITICKYFSRMAPVGK